MHLRIFAQSAIVGCLLVSGSTAYAENGDQAGTAGAARTIELFRPVFEIMTLEAAKDSPGCRGCHIGSDAFITWGTYTVETAEETLDQLEQERPDLLAGGRSSSMAELLYNGAMPRLGRPWNQDELDLLDAWLITYE
jgi:hypothetical protein